VVAFSLSVCSFPGNCVGFGCSSGRGSAAGQCAIGRSTWRSFRLRATHIPTLALELAPAPSQHSCCGVASVSSILTSTVRRGPCRHVLFTGYTAARGRAVCFPSAPLSVFRHCRKTQLSTERMPRKLESTIVRFTDSRCVRQSEVTSSSTSSSLQGFGFRL